MYTFSSRLKTFSFVLMLLGAIGIGIGFYNAPKDIAAVEAILKAAEHHEGGGHAGGHDAAKHEKNAGHDVKKHVTEGHEAVAGHVATSAVAVAVGKTRCLVRPPGGHSSSDPCPGR